MDAGGGLVLLLVGPQRGARDTYKHTGQYVSVKASGDARAGYFVLASDVGADVWELIIRPGSEAANAILAVPDEGSILVSDAQGRGFPFEEARGRPLLLAATGSGIAAMRAVVSHRVREKDAPRTELLLGVRSRADVPLLQELDAWRTDGVRVTVCLSREETLDEAGLAKGYVQEVARRTAKEAARHGGMIFAAGVKPMIEGIRALAQELGVAEADVRTNY